MGPCGLLKGFGTVQTGPTALAVSVSMPLLLLHLGCWAVHRVQCVQRVRLNMPLQALVLATLFPLVQSVLFKLTVYDGRIFLRNRTSLTSTLGRYDSLTEIAANLRNKKRGSERQHLLGKARGQRSPLGLHSDSATASDKEQERAKLQMRAAQEDAGVVSRLFAVWQFGLVRLGSRATLTVDDMIKLPDSTASSKHAGQVFEDQSSVGSAGSVGTELLRLVRSKLCAVLVCSTVQASHGDASLL